jgi:hypothetical protein
VRGVLSADVVGDLDELEQYLPARPSARTPLTHLVHPASAIDTTRRTQRCADRRHDDTHGGALIRVRHAATPLLAHGPERDEILLHKDAVAFDRAVVPVVAPRWGGGVV